MKQTVIIRAGPAIFSCIALLLLLLQGRRTMIKIQGEGGGGAVLFYKHICDYFLQQQTN